MIAAAICIPIAVDLKEKIKLIVFGRYVTIHPTLVSKDVGP